MRRFLTLLLLLLLISGQVVHTSGCARAQPALTTTLAASCFQTEGQVSTAASANQEALPGQALSASFFAGGTRLMLSYSFETVDIWDMQTGTRLQRIDCGDEELMGSPAVITPDGKYIFMGGLRGWFVAWDKEHNRRIPDWGGEFSTFGDDNGCLSLAVSPDGKRLLLGGYERVELYSLYTKRVLHVLYHLPRPQSDGASLHVAFSPNGKYALVAAGNRVLLYDVATGRETRKFTVDRQTTDVQTTYAAFSPDNTCVLTISVQRLKRIIRLWNWRTGKMLREFTPLTDHLVILSGAFTPDGKCVVCGGDYIHVWNVDTGKEVNRFPTSTERFGYANVLVSPDGKYVLSTGANTELWKLATGERVPFWTVPPPGSSR